MSNIITTTLTFIRITFADSKMNFYRSQSATTVIGTDRHTAKAKQV